MIDDPDPFPKIPPALLNSADIEAYQERLEIFAREDFSRDRLKSASYELLLAGEVFRWKKGQLNFDRTELSENQPYMVEPNEIVFISLGTKIKLPHYLAIRFNLTISMVHRGLLLGTGPLVDPGFEGNLLIPLHNLTSSVLPLNKGMSFIWVEITKVSPYPPLDGAHQNKLVEFPKDKKNRKPLKYFERANGNLPISSILRETYEQVSNLQNKMRNLAILGVVAGAVSVGGLIFAGITLYIDSSQLVKSAQGEIFDRTEEKISSLRKDIEGQMEALKEENKRLRLELKKSKD